MEDSERKSSIKRTIAEVNPTDVGRGIVRISKADAKILAVDQGDLLELKSEKTKSPAFAKCFFIHPSNESSSSGIVQVDGLTRKMLGTNIRENLTIAKAERPIEAISVTLEPMDGIIPESLDEKWLRFVIEDKPLFKHGVVVVLFEDKGFFFKITSLEPSDRVVAVGTMLTRIVLLPRQ